jgi:hypothetical protein
MCLIRSERVWSCVGIHTSVPCPPGIRMYFRSHVTSCDALAFRTAMLRSDIVWFTLTAMWEGDCPSASTDTPTITVLPQHNCLVHSHCHAGGEKFIRFQ